MGGYTDVGPRDQPWPQAVAGELEGPGSGAFGGGGGAVSLEGRMCPLSFPVLGSLD